MCLAKTSGMRFGGSAGRMGSSFSGSSSMRDSMQDSYDRQVYGPSSRQSDRASGYASTPSGIKSTPGAGRNSGQYQRTGETSSGSVTASGPDTIEEKRCIRNCMLMMAKRENDNS